MNKSTLLAAIMIMLLTISALSQTVKTESGSPALVGIQFFHGTWAEVLKESQKTGKPVFVDAYASWCGPCRMMAANTFTDAEVGKLFNQHFVNYKIDMEKGEGPALRVKYRVTHYPTYLFVDSQGNLKYRVMGYMVPEMFIGEGRKAVEAFKSSD